MMDFNVEIKNYTGRKSIVLGNDFGISYDDAENIINNLDLSTTKRPNHDQKRINTDFPVWVTDLLDREASRVGVTRQSIIKPWLVERLEEKSC